MKNQSVLWKTRKKKNYYVANDTTKWICCKCLVSFCVIRFSRWSYIECCATHYLCMWLVILDAVKIIWWTQEFITFSVFRINNKFKHLQEMYWFYLYTISNNIRKTFLSVRYHIIITQFY